MTFISHNKRIFVSVKLIKNTKMGKKGYKCNMMLLSTLVCGMLQGCMKDVFNAEKVKATYADKFPIDNIDPAMDWKMTQPIDIQISINEDPGETYTVSIYDGNPLAAGGDAHLMARGEASSSKPFVTSIDCPTAYGRLYVCRTDRHHRNVVKAVAVEGSTLEATFGNNRPASRQAATRAGEAGEVPTLSLPYTESEVQAMADKASVLQSNTKLKAGQIYKIPEGTIFQNDINNNGLPADNPAKVIIEGTWECGGNLAHIETGVEIIVAGGGVISLPDSKDAGNSALYFNGTSHLIVCPGGKITAQKKGETYIYIENGSKDNYNAGDIEVGTLHINGGQLYNSGNLNAKTLNNEGGLLINRGQATIGEVSNANSHIENGCFLRVTSYLLGHLTMAPACAAEISKFGDDSGNAGKRIVMGENSLITITGEAYLNYCTVSGPQAGHSLIKINILRGIHSFRHESGLTYYEVQTEYITGGDADWQKDTFLDQITNSEGVLAKWGESPVVIPEGDCTGKGNTPEEGSQTPDNPIVYTYVYEDNFPMVGDYDINDAVLDVTTQYLRREGTNAIHSIRYHITVAAAGATKHPLGIGLRLAGVPKGAVKTVTAGAGKERFHATLTDGQLFTFNPSSCTEDDANAVVIPITGNAHLTFEGGREGEMTNTGFVTHKPGTYEITLELADPSQTKPVISKDHLDFFLCYPYKSMGKRMEVHLYEFWKYGATASGTVQQTNLDLAGNNTWAFCVPNFRYPKESINICDESDPTNCAYPEFLGWARDRNTNQDWYLHPNTANVYR